MTRDFVHQGTVFRGGYGEQEEKGVEAKPEAKDETGDEPADSHAECGAKRDDDGAADEALEPLRKRSHQTVAP